MNKEFQKISLNKVRFANENETIKYFKHLREVFKDDTKALLTEVDELDVLIWSQDVYTQYIEQAKGNKIVVYEIDAVTYLFLFTYFQKETGVEGEHQIYHAVYKSTYNPQTDVFEECSDIDYI